MKRFLPYLMLLLWISGLSYYRWQSDWRSADPTALDSVLVAPRYFAAAEAPALSECLLTPDGSRLRVLVVRQNAVVEQDDNPEAGPAVTLAPLTSLFVFSCRPNAIDAGRYQVGTTPYRESVLGWIAAEDVVPWRNHEGLRVKPRIRDQVTKVPVFSSPISGPTQDATATPIAWLLDRSGQPAVAATRPTWPVLEQVTVSAGPESAVWYCVLLDTRQLQPAFAAPEQRWSNDSLNVPLDMVFLFENTTTTRPYRFAFLTAAREMIATAEQQGPLIAFAVNSLGIRQDQRRRARNLTGNIHELTEAVEDFDPPSAAPVDESVCATEVLLDVLRTIRWRSNSRKVLVSLTGSGRWDSEHAQAIVQAANQSDVHLLTIRMVIANDSVATMRSDLVCEQLTQSTAGRCAIWDESFRPAAWFEEWLSDPVMIDGPVAASSLTTPTANIRPVSEVLATGRVEWVSQPPTSEAVVAGWVPARLEGVTLAERCSFLGTEEQQALRAEIASLRSYLLDSPSNSEAADPRCFFARPRDTTLVAHFRERGLPPLATRWNQSQSQLAVMSRAARQQLLHELEVVVDLASEPSSESASVAWIPTEAAQ